MDKQTKDAKYEEKSTINKCCVCLSNITLSSLPIELPCKHIGHYNCFMGIKNHLCPICRREIPKLLATKAELNANNEDLYKNLRWLYSGKLSNSWWYFEELLNNEIEEAYQIYLKDKNKNITKILIRGYDYTIDFITMKQKSGIGKLREIKRLEEPGKLNILGIGGLTIK